MKNQERNDLLKSKEYWMVQIQNDLYGMIEKYMQKNKLNRKGIAEKFGVSKGYITQVLKGDFDHKISKLVDLSLLINKVPVVNFIDVEKVINDDEVHDDPLYSQRIRPVHYSTFHFNTNISTTPSTDTSVATISVAVKKSDEVNFNQSPVSAFELQ